MRNFLYAFFVISALTGCINQTTEAKFSLIATGSELYRLNTATGQVSRISSEGIKVLQEQPLPLSVGSELLLENGVTMKYRGNGKFDSSSKW